MSNDKIALLRAKGVTAEDNADRNRDLERMELGVWALQPNHMLAYYSFPAEDSPLFGRPRVYRPSFSPCLHTFINAETVDSPGTAQHAVVKTWLGTEIGRIVSARVYLHNFGSRMVSLTVRGSNGATYYGRASYDNGTCVHLRKAKHVK